MRYVYKKNRCTLLSVNAPDVKEKRKVWAETIKKYSPEKLVYLDGSRKKVKKQASGRSSWICSD